ncbi:MAG: hypothetical protein AAFV49_23870, partial [Pseudomonadota bacterium]
MATIAAETVLFREPAVQVAAYGQRTRQQAWSILQELIARRGADLEVPPSEGVSKGLCFARGIAAAIEGEKDPRCLLRALRCAEAAAAQHCRADDAAGDALCVFGAAWAGVLFCPPRAADGTRPCDEAWPSRLLSEEEAPEEELVDVRWHPFADDHLVGLDRA